MLHIIFLVRFAYLLFAITVGSTYRFFYSGHCDLAIDFYSPRRYGNIERTLLFLIYTMKSTQWNLHDRIHTMRFYNGHDGHKSHDIHECHGSHKDHDNNDGHKNYNGEIYAAFLQPALRNPSKLPIKILPQWL